MRMFPQLIAAGLVVTACQSGVLRADDRTVWEQVQALGTELGVQQAEACVVSLRATRDNSVRRLIEVACDAKLSNHVRLAAINMLGDLRAVEAVNALMGQLDARIGVGEVLNEPTIFTLYPCTSALVKIGRPASRKAARMLREEGPGVRRNLLCHILKIVEGEETARRMVEQELQDTLPHHRQVRARLQAVLDSRFFSKRPI